MGYSEKSIAGIFHNRAEKYQYEPCVRYKKNGRYTAISWREMQRMVTNLGLGLISLGVKQDDIVTIFSENCWQWLVADLACLSIGSADAPIYATNSGEEAAYIINDSGSRFLFVSDQDHLNRILGVKSTLKGLKKIITFDPIETGDKNILSFDEVLRLGEEYKDKKVFEERLLSIDPEGLATLIYTSGTTGPPKGVMLTHSNFTANIMQCYASHPIIGHQDVALSLLPWSHSLGRTVSVYLMLHIGAVLNLAESFGTVMENMIEVRPTLMVSVPRLFEKIHSGIFSKVEKASPTKKKLFFWAVDVAMRAVDYKVQRKTMPWTLKAQYDLAEALVYSKLRQALGMDRIRIFINGGGALALDIDRFFNGIGINLHNGYGLTETSPVTNVNTFEVFEFGSVGPALADTQIKIADDGEILIKGPQVMKGYFNKPDDTKAAFTEDGWFLTGDIGRMDERGCLYITDRKKDIIITAGGKNVAPQNIENTLVTDPFIEQAVVIGEGRKYLSALIIPNFAELVSYAKNQGISFDSNEDLIKKPEIISFYDDKIKNLMKDYSRVEQIRRFTLLPREFSIETGELTPTLKMKRKIISQNYKDVIEAMYKE
ncbi:MAG: AMP-dependent synthetase/ligase [Desulfomonilia bacterium]|jgi:long-chain acyl-CoA synthetase|uniref:Long-chain-fatty-acid--CoA ligase FadD15 n=1 Tax=anaerobic digester metagenome TaxID=1263854 RepID=A0A485M620_9ZZZZ|nr:long-chain fatty acid--CoA ligase [Pseudomonadota bacterium]HON37715.1 long-chain fatty acid--CoA ligase [Deltaproteobacteria bacterium]HRS55190.1 long-chain fatty acid--CoA ligase [Desulfomonilia bacterium]HPD20356.1 long-chain fatty acid--CoA ligase [Deltaproteobacteria bacterium]HPX17187.1 long-chain fatty acid--CoA ligase [Deltaproteobacteria bacterium]